MEQGNSRKQDYAEARRTNYLLEIQSLPDKNTKNNHSSFKLLNSCFANKSVSLTCENMLAIDNEALKISISGKMKKIVSKNFRKFMIL